MIKTFALASIIYEDDLSESSKLPFKHSVADIELLASHERDLQKDVALVSTFGSFTSIVETLDDEDKVPEDQL